MNRSVAIGIKALAVLVLLSAALWVGSAAAQYPPPTGNLVLNTSSTSPPTGSTVSISATASDPTGTPISGLSCTFSIVSQPGAGAYIDPGPYVTDVYGIARTNLTVGDTAGTILVGCDCGQFSSVLSVAAGAEETAAAQLPATGTGLDGSDGWTVSTLALIFGVAAVAGLGVAWATRRWIRS
jgi:hypothetical protein